MKTIIKRVENYKIVNYIRNTFFENFCIFLKKIYWETGVKRMIKVASLYNTYNTKTMKNPFFFTLYSKFVKKKKTWYRNQKFFL